MDSASSSLSGSGTANAAASMAASGDHSQRQASSSELADTGSGLAALVPASSTTGSNSTTGVATGVSDLGDGHMMDRRTQFVDADYMQRESATKAEIQDALAALERERQSVETGTHPDFMQKCAVFEAVRIDSVAQAATQRQLALQSVQHMYEFMLHSADRMCENSKTELRTNLLRDLSDRISDLQGKLSGQPEQKTEASAKNAPQRRLRSKAKADEPASATSTSTEQPMAATAPAAISLMQQHLPSTDCLSDMKAIYRDWKACAARWRATAATAMLPARVERGRLLYANESFAKGDPVVVFSELTKQEFVGEVHHLSAGEAIVKLDGGTKCRIPLQHLRHGRVSMYRYIPSLGGAAAPGAAMAPVMFSAGGVPMDMESALMGGAGGLSAGMAHAGMAAAAQGAGMGPGVRKPAAGKRERPAEESGFLGAQPASQQARLAPSGQAYTGQQEAPYHQHPGQRLGDAAGEGDEGQSSGRGVSSGLLPPLPTLTTMAPLPPVTQPVAALGSGPLQLPQLQHVQQLQQLLQTGALASIPLASAVGGMQQGGSAVSSPEAGEPAQPTAQAASDGVSGGAGDEDEGMSEQ